MSDGYIAQINLQIGYFDDVPYNTRGKENTI